LVSPYCLALVEAHAHSAANSQEEAMRTILRVAAIVGVTAVFAGSVTAAPCIGAGGWGTGALEGFASFMAEAAMKNSAKAKLGDAVKIGPVAQKCEVKGLLYECTATARACK
jgi:hypothetical protein